MPDRDGFRVAVKASAADASEPTRALVAERGETLRFDSRSAAEALAADLSERGSVPVAIQRAAPQDASGADAYLVADPERHTHEPIEREDGRLTFQTTAAQYGALGEALLCSSGTTPPALLAYAREDLAGRLEDEEAIEDRWIDVEDDPDPVVYGTADGGGRMAWVPDCVATVGLGVGGPVLETYACEVKTGDASFQRDQAAVMAYEARERTVLKVRVDVTGLPDAYTVRIDAVEAEVPPAGVSNLAEPDARLDDFA